ncbi:hypothetical protein NMY22_g16392 [Coprinellus aureogranulatus]|nr:hypothetical protein NMY22_g16392 [Coprinellus aureogranulatus]
MPAMSPTMTEGGIAEWKKKEGEAFSAGDVLLEIETDKATIDVEAQDDGIVGKILVGDGTKGVPVGKVIALLAEEGDDISNLEAPKEEPTPSKKEETSSKQAESSSSTAAAAPESAPQQPAVAHTLPPHSKTLFPSVHRLILEHGIKISMRSREPECGASNPNGTFTPAPSPIEEARKSLTTAAPGKKATEVKTLDGDALRRLIVNSMLEASLKARNVAPDYRDADFDSVLADYLPPVKKAASVPSATPASKPAKQDLLDGLH